MEDRYLFRGKRIDNGEWVVGYIARYGYTGKEKYFIIPNYASDLYAFLIDKNTICQCTGLKDKNGKLIYENDIVKCGNTTVVDWNEHFASWCLTKKGWMYHHFFGESQEPKDCEVIGNTFDNPELLEG